MWGLTKAEEEEVRGDIVQLAEVRPLDGKFVESEEISVRYFSDREPAIRNDVITLRHRLWRDGRTRLAIAHALAQSTKLSVFEEQGLELVRSLRQLPRELADRGQVSHSRSKLSRLIARLLVQKGDVALVSSVLDVPEFFWHAPDSLQELYKRVCEYLEMGERIEAMNGRLAVSQSMLDMVQNEQNNSHGEFLECIIIWLIVLCVIIGLLQLSATIGLIPHAS